MGDSSEPVFEPMPKIARLMRKMIITEKLDGTNACVHVTEDGTLRAGSRTRWITPTDDNFGFARWVAEHAAELLLLGPGQHFGEWWGSGIQRRYGLDHKRFSLFNVARWGDGGTMPRPACCHVVPVLYAGPFSTAETDRVTDDLARMGSHAAPGFMQPEGIMVYHVASKALFKRTIVGDDKGKDWEPTP